MLFVLLVFSFGLFYNENSFLNPRYIYVCLLESLDWFKPSSSYRTNKRVIQWDGKHSTDLLATFGQPVSKLQPNHKETTVWAYNEPPILFHIRPSDGKILKAYIYERAVYMKHLESLSRKIEVVPEGKLK